MEKKECCGKISSLDQLKISRILRQPNNGDEMDEIFINEANKLRQIIEKHHNPETLDRLNHQRARSFIKRKTGVEANCAIYCIDDENYYDIMSQFFDDDQDIPSLGGFYDSRSHAIVLFYDTNAPVIINESILVHELAHSTGYRTMDIEKSKNEDDKVAVATSRLGFSTRFYNQDGSVGRYGRFFEELCVSQIQIEYLHTFAPKSFYAQLATSAKLDISSPEKQDFERLVYPMYSPDNELRIYIPALYMMISEGKLLIEQSSKLALIGDLIQYHMEKNGVNFSELLIASRQNLTLIKFLARSLKVLFGEQHYSLLQKIPVNDPKYSDILFYLIHHLQNPDFLDN